MDSLLIAFDRMKKPYSFLLLVVIASLVSNCFPAYVDYQMGWTTQRISGKIELQGSTLEETTAFIVVQEYYASGVQFENQPPRYRPNAKLVFPDQSGNFQFNFDLQASKVHFALIAQGYQMQTFRLQRQIGVGDISYDANLEKVENWKDYLILFISPFLQPFITEQRYRLEPTHQLYLGNWLTEQQEQFFVP